MRFSLGRTEVHVTFGAALFLAFCIVLGEGRTLLYALLSLAVHEAAHAIAARNLGIPITKATVYPFGAVMRIDLTPTGGRGEWIVAAAGPLGSLTFAALLRLSDLFLPAGGRTEQWIEINLLIALINLLPAFPLDGGRIFRAALQTVTRERTARTVLLVFTCVIASAAIAVGVSCAVRGYPAWTLFLIPPFLVASAIREWRMPDTGIVARVIERGGALKNGAAQKAQIVVIRDAARVGDAVAMLSGTRFTIVRVLGAVGFTDMDEDMLIDAAAKFGMQTPLKTVISRLTEPK